MPSRRPNPIPHLVRCRTGAAAIEYALVAALIACAIVAAMGGVGANVDNTMSAVKDELPSGAPLDVQVAP